MTSNSVVFNISVEGNANNVVNTLSNSVNEMTKSISKSINIFNTFQGSIVVWQQASQLFGNLSNSIKSCIQPGIDFDSSLRELSAVTGQTGEGLQLIGKYARESAKIFGGSASNAVESYKLLLSQLSPEIAKNPEALKAMGESVQVLSKSMGGDATAAAETLTTAMNQYGVSLDNPVEASKAMSDMMNVMSAAANAGSAELPQIKQALEQAGMAAKTAGVSFEETNAAIQVLDKAGKKGSEGGVALRNVMTTLARGRFLPKEVREELAAAGININELTDKSRSLQDRLSLLKGVSEDTALFTKLFGRENASAAMALVDGTDAIGKYTEAVTGTNDAYQYAETVMESYSEKQARIQSKFEDLKISIFNATGDLGIWVQTVSTSLVPVAQLIPLLSGVGSMFKTIKEIKFADTMNLIRHSITGAKISLAFMRNDLITCNMATLGFRGNMIRAALAILRFTTVGIFSAIKGVGALILSLITGGATSVKFANIASLSFGKFALSAQAACKAVSVAIKNIPVFGWIIAITTAVAGLFVWLYNKFDRFRATVNGIWAWFKALFTSEDASEAFDNAYAETMREAKEKRETEKEGENDPLAELERQQKELEDKLKESGSETTTNLDIQNKLDKNSVNAAGDKKIKNIYISIDKVVDKFTIHTTNLKQDAYKTRDMILEAIEEGLNDVNLAF